MKLEKAASAALIAGEKQAASDDAVALVERFKVEDKQKAIAEEERQRKVKADDQAAEALPD